MAQNIVELLLTAKDGISKVAREALSSFWESSAKMQGSIKDLLLSNKT